MPAPLKTRLLKDMEQRFRAVAGLATVRREFELPFDLAAEDAEGNLLAPCPALFFWEGPEAEEEQNLFTLKELELSLVLFMALEGIIGDGQTPTFQTFSDAAEALAQPIKAVLSDPANLAAWRDLGLQDLEAVGQSKALSNESYGEMVLTYRLTYGHRLGDPSSL